MTKKTKITKKIKQIAKKKQCTTQESSVAPKINPEPTMYSHKSRFGVLHANSLKELETKLTLVKAVATAHSSSEADEAVFRKFKFELSRKGTVVHSICILPCNSVDDKINATSVAEFWSNKFNLMPKWINRFQITSVIMFQTAQALTESFGTPPDNIDATDGRDYRNFGFDIHFKSKQAASKFLNDITEMYGNLRICRA